MQSAPSKSAPRLGEIKFPRGDVTVRLNPGRGRCWVKQLGTDLQENPPAVAANEVMLEIKVQVSRPTQFLNGSGMFGGTSPPF